MRVNRCPTHPPTPSLRRAQLLISPSFTAEATSTTTLLRSSYSMSPVRPPVLVPVCSAERCCHRRPRQPIHGPRKTLPRHPSHRAGASFRLSKEVSSRIPGVVPEIVAPPDSGQASLFPTHTYDTPNALQSAMCPVPLFGFLIGGEDLTRCKCGALP